MYLIASQYPIVKNRHNYILLIDLVVIGNEEKLPEKCFGLLCVYTYLCMYIRVCIYMYVQVHMYEFRLNARVTDFEALAWMRYFFLTKRGITFGIT